MTVSLHIEAEDGALAARELKAFVERIKFEFADDSDMQTMTPPPLSDAPQAVETVKAEQEAAPAADLAEAAMIAKALPEEKPKRSRRSSRKKKEEEPVETATAEDDAQDSEDEKLDPANIPSGDAPDIEAVRAALREYVKAFGPAEAQNNRIHLFGGDYSKVPDVPPEAYADVIARVLTCVKANDPTFGADE